MIYLKLAPKVKMKPKNSNPFCNIATYRFVTIDEQDLPTLRKELKRTAASLEIKGTILIGTEGINLFLAGEHSAIKQFQEYLEAKSKFKGLDYKYSYSDFIPFHKLFVKIRNEIVTFRQEDIHPEEFTAPYITPQQFKEWYNTNHEMLVLDTRNTFEFEMGTFKNAMHLKIDNFREFPKALSQLQTNKKIPVVTFCTGGIRCEKAAAYLIQQGYSEVYQLQGGILNYFEQCGGEHYKGDCFVFDDRIALNSNLEPVENS